MVLDVQRPVLVDDDNQSYHDDSALEIRSASSANENSTQCVKDRLGLSLTAGNHYMH